MHYNNILIFNYFIYLYFSLEIDCCEAGLFVFVNNRFSQCKL